MNSSTEELPKLKMDDTAAPEAVLKKVEELKASGKKVSAKMSASDYRVLMSLPHEDRLEYAMKIMRQLEKKAGAKSSIDRRLAEQRKRRKDASKRKRQLRRKRSK